MNGAGFVEGNTLRITSLQAIFLDVQDFKAVEYISLILSNFHFELGENTRKQWHRGKICLWRLLILLRLIGVILFCLVLGGLILFLMWKVFPILIDVVRLVLGDVIDLVLRMVTYVFIAAVWLGLVLGICAVIWEVIWAVISALWLMICKLWGVICELWDREE